MPNVFDQFDAPAAPQKNVFDQFDAPKNAASAQPGINIPNLFGESFHPSLIGMVKGLLSGAQSGATLPRDVYQGKVDPLSQEGIGRATDMAAMTALPSAGRTMAMPAAEPTTAAELKAAARPTFDELRQAGNTIAVPGKDIAQSLVADLHPQNFREVNAGRTYRDVNRLSSAQDLNDVANIRDKLRDTANGISENKLIKVGGADATAAGFAKDALDTQIEKLSPGWVDKMKTADANWAASKRIDTVMKEADKGQKGRLGSFDSNETRAKGFTPDELAAIKKAHVGGNLGVLFNNIGAHTNLFHGGLEGMVGGPLNLAAKIPLTPLGMVSDAIAKSLRQKALNDAIQKIASRSPVGQQKALTGGIIGMPQLALPPPTMGLLPMLGSAENRRLPLNDYAVRPPI
jgi:hypothetical protein